MTELFLYREGFTTLCREFQRDIDIGKNDELRALLSEKDLHENEIHLLDKNNNALKNSMSAFVEEILGDLHNSTLVILIVIALLHSYHLKAYGHKVISFGQTLITVHFLFPLP